MNRSLCFASVLCVVAVSILAAQEHAAGMIDDSAEIQTAVEAATGIRRRSVVLDINARVRDNDQVIIWDESHQKITIPGSPVGIQLVGSNIVVIVQFTPFLRRNGNVLVAQGQIGIKNSDNTFSYYTSIQTIPMEFDEPIHFFPLGTAEHLNSSIEIIISVNRYRENAVTESAVNTDTDNNE